jgi:hypothetical protein
VQGWIKASGVDPRDRARAGRAPPLLEFARLEYGSRRLWLVDAAGRFSLALARPSDRQFASGCRLSHRLGLSSPPP